MTACEAPKAPRCYAGIDPSLTGTGICVLMDGEKPFLRTIATSPKTHPIIYDRLEEIVGEIRAVLFADYDFLRTGTICIERPFVSPQNMNAQQNLLVLSYTIREMLYRHNVPWNDVSPKTLKKFVCGKGKAEKSMMLMRVYQNWDISAGDDNQADACGLAHMAKAVDAARGNRDRVEGTDATAALSKFQFDVVRDMLAKG